VIPVPTTSSNSLLNKLSGGDRRSIGQSNKVTALVLRRPALFPQLMQGLWNSDPLIRMRAADAAEKVSLCCPDLLRPFKTNLLRLLDEATQQELRWHLAQMVPRLALSRKDRPRATVALRRYLEDKSSIVKTSAMQALADLAKADDELMPEVKKLLMALTESGTPAMRARGRKLLRRLKRNRD
jgi:hypothetical protein